MQLDSVRELKQIVAARLARQIAARAAHMSVATTELDGLPRANRTIALGVSPHAREFRLAVRVQRQALLDSPALERIRKLAHDEVDVRFVGRIRKRQTPWQRLRRRPLLIGLSVGHYKVTAGTLGALVRTRGRAEACVLSNNHVLANEDRAQAGDPVLQPGALDGGRRMTNAIGKLFTSVRLSDTRPNRVDAAIARLEPGIAFDPVTLRGLGKLARRAADPVTDGARVAKIGRTTGLTEGRVTAFEIDNVVVEYDRGNLTFDGQIEIEGAGERPFSDGGDSGSLIVNREHEAVALLFAGTDSGGRNKRGLTYANPIDDVLGKLKVDLLV